ncbi:hypothetical protein [Gordonia insulae]|uniref:Uncharacterized protein n=1 Tax=Gordonia insulae TaxID=2420509 RepID=A0A3G8JQ16_9ACTN|nr:hypothetical protein [Gordonia insulae]AZG47181.1 hypothetical protein D7316_03789 [Gordonia insulae]
MSNNKRIVKAALAARSIEEAEIVQQSIARALGTRYQRPLGDKGNNQGILTGSGASYDHKSLEVVTNMQDAVIELYALQTYGTRGAVPFNTPHEAASTLLSELGEKERAELATVTIDKAAVGSDKKRITLVMRDHGCGIVVNEVPRTIFQVGAGHKNGVNWQQGTYGLGGALTYLNAGAVVVVTRRHPDLLEPDDEDRISIAVVQRERVHTTANAYYLVTEPWIEGDPTTWAKAVPFSVPSADYPDFEPGTHVALIAYDTEGLGRRSGDEKSFDTILNTRLFRPVLPIKYRNNITRTDRAETLNGLERRLNDNPGEAGTEGLDTLPFNHDGTTYHLPIRFRLFTKAGSRGQRRNFVAHGHALLLTSNGQVHSHWSPQDFKLKTKLNKLYDRVLVIVASDQLPIEIRTELFTADRAQLVRSAVAIRLEKEIAAFLNDWPALRDANSALIREAISGDNNDRPTIAVAEQIARAFKAKGFSLGGIGMGGSGGGRKPPEPTRPEDLYHDPTHFEGPKSIEAQVGKVKGAYFKLNATDGFITQRAFLQVTCDHPDIGPAEITVGELRSGRVRVSIAVPDNADLGTYNLDVEIPEWTRTSGGLGPKFEWSTKIDIIEEAPSKPTGPKGGRDPGTSGPGDGGLVALIWKSEADDGVENWSAATVGEIEMVPAKDLAGQRSEYAPLAKVDGEIPTIVLNRTYSPLKNYIQARAAELTDESKEKSRERYAVGVGVALLVLDQDARDAQKAGNPHDEATMEVGRRAAARAVLSVMPEADRLVKELES